MCPETNETNEYGVPFIRLDSSINITIAVTLLHVGIEIIIWVFNIYCYNSLGQRYPFGMEHGSTETFFN